MKIPAFLPIELILIGSDVCARVCVLVWLPD